MARLRHIAVCVKDLEKAAKFYEDVFEMKMVGRETIEIGSAIYMSDGVINMALLNFAGAKGNRPRRIPGTRSAPIISAFRSTIWPRRQRRIEAAGGKFFFDLGDERQGNFERKFKDPDGVVFDISQHGWVGTDGHKQINRDRDAARPYLMNWLV